MFVTKNLQEKNQKKSEQVEDNYYFTRQMNFCSDERPRVRHARLTKISVCLSTLSAPGNLFQQDEKWFTSTSHIKNFVVPLFYPRDK